LDVEKNHADLRGKVRETTGRTASMEEEYDSIKEKAEGFQTRSVENRRGGRKWCVWGSKG